MSNNKDSSSSALARIDPSSVVLARLLLPDDANLSRTNVHGGVTLYLMEQAGMITATRFFNGDTSHQFHTKQVAGLARFETMSFHEPIYVGELASLTTSIMFTSKRSILVKVTVIAENLQTGNSRVTNTGMLWYLSFVEDDSGQSKPQLADIPQVSMAELTDSAAKKAYTIGKELYEARKQQEEKKETDKMDVTSLPCFQPSECFCPTCRVKSLAATSNDRDCNGDIAKKSRLVSESKQTLSQVVLPGDCGTGRVAHGGFVMKLMDNAAGCAAFRHARTNVVTISVSAMDFVDFVLLGDIVTITATMTFCSAKSMEISVVAATTSSTKSDTVVARATFTFVALDAKTKKVIPVPRLTYTTEDEFEKAYQSQLRYESAKRARIAKSAKA